MQYRDQLVERLGLADLRCVGADHPDDPALKDLWKRDAERCRRLRKMAEQGYRSVGCWPCTTPADTEDGARAGRWRGYEKTACGILRPKARSRA